MAALLLVVFLSALFWALFIYAAARHATTPYHRYTPEPTRIVRVPPPFDFDREEAA